MLIMNVNNTVSGTLEQSWKLFISYYINKIHDGNKFIPWIDNWCWQWLWGIVMEESIIFRSGTFTKISLLFLTAKYIFGRLPLSNTHSYCWVGNLTDNSANLSCLIHPFRALWSVHSLLTKVTNGYLVGMTFISVS